MLSHIAQTLRHCVDFQCTLSHMQCLRQLHRLVSIRREHSSKSKDDHQYSAGIGRLLGLLPVAQGPLQLLQFSSRHLLTLRWRTIVDGAVGPVKIDELHSWCRGTGPGSDADLHCHATLLHCVPVASCTLSASHGSNEPQHHGSKIRRTQAATPCFA